MSESKFPEALQEAFVQAAKIAEAVPETYRAVAFQRALDELLAPPSDAAHVRRTASAGEGAPGTPRPAGRHGGTRARGSEMLDELIAAMNRTELAALMAGRKALDRALLVLRAAQNHDIDEMSAQQIADVLTRKFKERTASKAVYMALERAPTLTDRREREGTVVYALMAPGERYLQGLSNGDGATEAAEGTLASFRSRSENRAARRRKGGQRGRTTAPTERVSGDGAEPEGESGVGESPGPTLRESTGGSSPRRSSGRPGPKALLEDLLSQGLFDTPQTIASLIEFVERKRGHRYKATDFAPTLTRLLREDKLDRDRNADGQYEYRKHSGA